MADQQNTSNINNFLIPISIVLVGMIIAGAIFFGLKSTRSPSFKTQEPAEVLKGEPVPSEQEPSAEQMIKTSIDDDAVLGNKETAKVAIVEFSDYECPFCKKFREETLDDIKRDYVDSGRAIFVYRDLPLDFHNPAAKREAIAAECAREQGGDEVYWQYHDKIFEKTRGNGQGIDIGGLVGIGEELGLNGEKLEECIKEERFEKEINNDAADAARVGIRGTPGFVVGKLDKEGNVEGIVISGAQPYPVFQKAIDSFLD